MAKDAKTRAKARVMHEKGMSFSEIISKIPVSLRTVKLWCKNDGWIKGDIAPVLHQIEQESAQAAAARMGLTRAKVTQKVLDLMDAQSVAVITTQGAISLCALKPGEYGEKADFQNIAYDVVPDRRTQMEATKLGADILGMKKADVESERNNDNLLTLIRSMRPK